MTTTVANIEKALKIRYEKTGHILAYESHPLFEWFPKTTDFTGRNRSIQVRNEGGMGRSALFATAASTQTANSYKEFNVTRVSNYAIGYIANEAMEAAVGGDSSAFDGIGDMIDGLHLTFGIDTAQTLYGSGTGKKGQAQTVVTGVGGTVQLTQYTDAIFFGVGMSIVTSTTDGGGVVKAAATITALDRETGLLTFDNVPVTWANNDYVFVNGDYDAKMKGLLAWVPTTAPTAGDNFYGVDRSSDPVFLAGQRYNGGGGTIESTLMTAMSRGYVQGSKFDAVFINPAKFNDLVLSLGNKIREPRPGGNGKQTVGYNSVMITSPQGGMVEVIPDPDCPLAYGFALTKKSWELHTLGKCPHPLTGADKKVLRPDADSWEVRIGAYGNVICKTPKDNMVITWLAR